MKELETQLVHEISGGSLMSDILNFFRGDSSSEKVDWTSNSTIPSPAIGKGDEYGFAIVAGLTAIAAAVAVGIGFLTRK